MEGRWSASQLRFRAVVEEDRADVFVGQAARSERRTNGFREEAIRASKTWK